MRKEGTTVRSRRPIIRRHEADFDPERSSFSCARRSARQTPFALNWPSGGMVARRWKGTADVRIEMVSGSRTRIHLYDGRCYPTRHLHAPFEHIRCQSPTTCMISSKRDSGACNVDRLFQCSKPCIIQTSCCVTQFLVWDVIFRGEEA